MRTRARVRKTVQTQMASWTELRHDTVLYVKQSYTDPVSCSYPYGYVEPRPEFWRNMRILAETTAASFRKLNYTVPNVVLNQPSFLNLFSSKMSELGAIAEKELAQLPLTACDIELLQNVVEIAVDYVGVPYWTGWYPALFYETTYGEQPACNTYDALVTDVHTDCRMKFRVTLVL